MRPAEYRIGMHRVIDDFQGPTPIRIWLDDGLLSSASRLDGYARAALAIAMRNELAKILRLRFCCGRICYQNYVDLGAGFLTVVVIEDDIYFRYRVGEPPLGPVPPRPPLSAPNSIIGWLHQALSVDPNLSRQEILGFGIP